MKLLLECLALLLNREIRSIRHKERRIVLYEMCRFVNGRLPEQKVGEPEEAGDKLLSPNAV